RDQILARLAHTSELVRRRLGAPQRFSYGEKSIEGLDVYRTAKPNAPICVFVHGGAWRAGLARDYAFPAEMLLRAGAHFVARDFADALTRAGKSAELIRAEGYNHFEIAESLGNPYGPLGRALLAQMKLA